MRFWEGSNRIASQKRRRNGVANWPILGQTVASPMCCKGQKFSVFERLARLASRFRQAGHFEFADSHKAAHRYQKSG